MAEEIGVPSLTLHGDIGRNPARLILAEFGQPVFRRTLWGDS
jgi:hypothetical protein